MSGFCKTVPGAYILAGITTKEPIVEFVFHIPGYQLLLEFNRKIRNAFTAIYHLIFQDGIRRTGINTFPAAATIILCIRIIILQRKVCNKRSDEKEGTSSFCKQVTIFAYPPQATAQRPGPFNTGAESTNPLPCTSPICSRINASSLCNFPRITS